MKNQTVHKMLYGATGIFCCWNASDKVVTTLDDKQVTCKRCLAKMAKIAK